MGFFNFTGGAQRGDLKSATRKANRTLKAGYTEARDITKTYLDPYATAGRKGFDLYGDAIGIGGPEGYARAFETFQADPFMAYADRDTERRLGDVFQSYNAQGLGNSGVNRLAVGRLNEELAGGRVADFRNRLANFGDVGRQTATHVSDRLGDLRYGYAQQRAGNQINLGNAIAASRSTGINNLFKLGSLGVKAAGAFLGA